MNKAKQFIPRVLIDNNINSSILLQLVKENKFDLDTRSFLSVGNEKCASPLTEYDLVILNYNVNTLITEVRQTQVLNYLKSRKVIIYILRKYEHTPQTNYFHIKKLFNNLNIFNIAEIGDKYELTQEGENSIFKDYLDCDKKSYKISVINNQENKINSLARNTEGNTIAFAHKDYPNNCYFLPWLQDNEEEFWNIVVELAYGNLKSGEPVKDWVKEYNFKQLIDTYEEIDKLQESIDKLEIDKSSLIDIKENYERIRDTLLYRDGIILQNVVKEVLQSLGIDAKDGANYREDITFIYKKNHYVIEVKGLTKSVAEKNISQLNSKKAQYETENRIKAKGILIVNAWRELPFEERDTNEKPLFPNQINKLVDIWDIALITTHQLFVAYCKNLSKKFDLEEFVNSIKNVEGFVDIHNEINEYKIDEKPDVNESEK